MTEAEWFKQEDPQPMLDFLRGMTSDRKLRLFACACCRHVWDLLIDERSRTAITSVENAIDTDSYVCAINNHKAHAAAAELTAQTSIIAILPDKRARLLAQARAMAATAAAQVTQHSTVWKYASAGHIAATTTSSACAMAAKFSARAKGHAGRTASKNERLTQSFYLYDIIGNPFSSAKFLSKWRTPEVFQLASGIYEHGDFERLSLVGKALVAAGCTDESILKHCAHARRHVKGCWVIDSILQKQ